MQLNGITAAGEQYLSWEEAGSRTAVNVSGCAKRRGVKFKTSFKALKNNAQQTGHFLLLLKVRTRQIDGAKINQRQINI